MFTVEHDNIGAADGDRADAALEPERYLPSGAVSVRPGSWRVG
jgi:hypothetical protein